MEGVEEVEDDPGNDDVVVEADVDYDHHRGYPDSGEVGEEFVPDEDGALPETLTQEQLQVEERDAQEKQHDQVGDYEGTCVGRVSVSECFLVSLEYTKP